MVKYKVVVTPRAQTSIRRIVDRLRATVSKQTADHVLKGIKEAIKKLVTFPESHEVEHLVSDEVTEYRCIIDTASSEIYTLSIFP